MRTSTRGSEKTPAASDILSDIVPAKSANGGKRQKTNEKPTIMKLTESERLGRVQRTVANGRKTIRRNPCLPAKFDPRVGTSCKPKNHEHFIVATMVSQTGT
jgi:hypothetical protein